MIVEQTTVVFMPHTTGASPVVEVLFRVSDHDKPDANEMGTLAYFTTKEAADAFCEAFVDHPVHEWACDNTPGTFYCKWSGCGAAATFDSDKQLYYVTEEGDCDGYTVESLKGLEVPHLFAVDKHGKVSWVR